MTLQVRREEVSGAPRRPVRQMPSGQANAICHLGWQLPSGELHPPQCIERG